MKRKFISIISIFVVFFVCSCGESVKKDSTVTVKESVPPKENTPEPTEESVVLFRKENVKIEGRHYTYIDYKVEVGGGISLYSLKTKDSVLYIPARIDGKPVWFIEGSPDQYAWQKHKKDKLKKIVIPEGVKEIIRMKKVTAEEIILPKSLKEIHMLAFQNADIKKVVIHNPKTNIGRAAFYNSNLEQINLPNGFCGKMEEGCFENTKIVKFHWPNYNDMNAKERMGKEVFLGCKKLKTIIFPENQKHIYIPYNTFWGCALKQLVFPASTKKVTYKECYYAGNYKNGVSTLVFKGKNTKVAGGNVKELGVSLNDSVPKGRNFITVKTIVAPKNSKAYEFAKNAVVISHMKEWKPYRHIYISIRKKDFIPVRVKEL